MTKKSEAQLLALVAELNKKVSDLQGAVATTEAAKVKPVTVKSRKTQVAALNAARDAYFKKMGYGPYRSKKAAPEAAQAVKPAPQKGKRARVAALAAGREAYFKRMGFGKYRKKTA